MKRRASQPAGHRVVIGQGGGCSPAPGPALPLGKAAIYTRFLTTMTCLRPPFSSPAPPSRLTLPAAPGQPGRRDTPGGAARWRRLRPPFPPSAPRSARPGPGGRPGSARGRCRLLLGSCFPGSPGDERQSPAPCTESLLLLFLLLLGAAASPRRSLPSPQRRCPWRRSRSPRR